MLHLYLIRHAEAVPLGVNGINNLATLSLGVHT